jgi:hypothetical protein
VTTIDWGFLSPATQKTYAIYVSNEGITPLTLSLSTSNWNPTAAPNYLTLTWNFDNGRTLNSSEAVRVTLTLAVSDSITGINNFNITAEGSM